MTDPSPSRPEPKPRRWHRGMVWDVPVGVPGASWRVAAYTLTFKGAKRLAARMEAAHDRCEPGCSSLWEYQPGPYRWPDYTAQNGQHDA